MQSPTTWRARPYRHPTSSTWNAPEPLSCKQRDAQLSLPQQKRLAACARCITTDKTATITMSYALMQLPVAAGRVSTVMEVILRAGDGRMRRWSRCVQLEE